MEKPEKLPKPEQKTDTTPRQRRRRSASARSSASSASDVSAATSKDPSPQQASSRNRRSRGRRSRNRPPTWNLINPIRINVPSEELQVEYLGLLETIDLESLSMDPLHTRPPQDLTLGVACPYCEHAVEHVLDSVHDPLTGQSAHLQCVLEALSKHFHADLRPQQHILYMGGGNFAIVESRKLESDAPVHRIIQMIPKDMDITEPHA